MPGTCASMTCTNVRYKLILECKCIPWVTNYQRCVQVQYIAQCMGPLTTYRYQIPDTSYPWYIPVVPCRTRQYQPALSAHYMAHATSKQAKRLAPSQTTCQAKDSSPTTRERRGCLRVAQPLTAAAGTAPYRCCCCCCCTVLHPTEVKQQISMITFRYRRRFLQKF